MAPLPPKADMAGRDRHVDPVRRKVGRTTGPGLMRVVRLLDEPDWQSRLLRIEEIFFATSPSAKTLQPDECPPFKERWLGRYISE